jgi:hypothetical protein
MPPFWGFENRISRPAVCQNRVGGGRERSIEAESDQKSGSTRKLIEKRDNRYEFNCNVVCIMFNTAFRRP